MYSSLLTGDRSAPSVPRRRKRTGVLQPGPKVNVQAGSGPLKCNLSPAREAGSSQEVRTPGKQRGGASAGATWLPQQSWQGENIKKENALRGKEG